MEKKIQQNTICPARREFLSKAGALAALTACSASFAALLNSCEYTNVPTLPDAQTLVVDIAKTPELSKAGGAFQYREVADDPSKPVYNIIRLSEEKFLVVDAHCTHQRNIVDLPTEEEPNKMICPVHLAGFSANDGSKVDNPFTGENIPGLKRIPATFNKEKNTLTLFV